MLLRAFGRQRVHLRKCLCECFQRQETACDALIVSVAQEGRADDEPDNRPVERGPSQAKVRLHFDIYVFG